MALINEPLVKIVPAGSTPTPHSPFWAKESDLDAAIKAGKNLSTHFGLPIGSEAPRYEAYRIAPKVPTEVFISTVAATSELEGRVRKAGGATQYILPNRHLFDAPVHVKSVENLQLANNVTQRVLQQVGAADEAFALKPGFKATVRGAGALGAAGLAYDAVSTGQDAARLLDQGNVTGAQSQVMHFGGRTGGGVLAGAAAGAAYGAATGSWTGPGAVAFGAAGGVIGAVAGDKLMDEVDRIRIYNQNDAQGHRWHYDEKRPDQGWSRTAQTHEIDPQAIPNLATGEPAYKSQTLRADAALADKLTYQASSTAVELALPRASAPQNPFSQPAGPTDAHAPDATLWTRHPDTRQWSRVVADPVQAAMGIHSSTTEQASRERSAQLDQAAKDTIASNIANGKQGIAQRYQDAYDQSGWKQHGPVPAAVTNAEHTPPGSRQVQASPAVTASPAPQTSIPRMATHEDHVKPSPGAVPFEQAHLRRFDAEQISPGSLQPVGKLDAFQPGKASPLSRVHQAQEQDLMRGLGIAQAQDKERFKNETSPQRTAQPAVERTPQRVQEKALGRPLDEAPVQKQHAPRAPEVQAPTATRGEHVTVPATHTSAPGQASPASPTTSVSVQSVLTSQPVQPTQPAQQSPAAPVAASDAKLHAEMAAMKEQIARLTAQQGQNHPSPRSGNDERQFAHTAQATPGSRAHEPSAPRTAPVASTRPSDPHDSAHPDHRDFQKIYAAVAQNGRWDAQQSTRIASQVLADFRTHPLGKRVDVVSVEPDKNGRLTVFAGHAPWGEQRGCLGMTTVDPAQAVRAPVEQGFDRLAQVYQQQEGQQRMRQGLDQGQGVQR